MHLVKLPAINKNCIWMLHDAVNAAGVDPGDTASAHAALDEQGLALAAILVTHRSADQGDPVDGGYAGQACLRGPVWGSADKNITPPDLPLTENGALLHYFEQCTAQRAAGLPPLPSSIELESKINPFLRCNELELAVSARAHAANANTDASVGVLAALRLWKNNPP